MTSSMPRLCKESLLSGPDFLKIRDQKRRTIMDLKNLRRVEVGPYAVFLFECFDTLWWQIQEMLRIEEGGDAQMEDELAAYGPLMPRGNDWTCTLMFEIPNAAQRREKLSSWGHIEQTISVDLSDGSSVKAQAIGDDARTTPDGKTSAVHFLRFSFAPDQIAALKTNSEARVTLSIGHPQYSHAATLSLQTLRALVQDFSSARIT